MKIWTIALNKFIKSSLQYFTNLSYLISRKYVEYFVQGCFRKHIYLKSLFTADFNILKASFTFEVDI